MGQMITKPDANPIVLAAANFFVLGAAGYYLAGQKKKAMIAAGVLIGMWFLSGCTFFLLSPLVAIANCIFAYDAYLIGQKLQSGQSVGENENGLEFLNAIFKD